MSRGLMLTRRAKAQPKVAVSQERSFEIVRRPIVTEKSSMGAEHNQYTFEVAMNATKPEIKAAVESVFGVKVQSVNTLVNKGKVKRFRGKLGQRSNWKKAIVRLEAGQSLDATAGV